MTSTATPFLFATVVACWTSLVSACPFCSALAPTISEDLISSSAAVIARCDSVSVEPDGLRVYQMRITELIKGAPELSKTEIEVVSTDDLPPSKSFWVLGYGDSPTQWISPKQTSTKALPYLRGLSRLPEPGPKRLGYFLRFLGHADELVASDAYNEFAEATLDDIAALRDKLDRDWVIDQLRDKSVPVHRRRLCWTFLSQCGTAEDAGLFDETIRIRESDPIYDPGMDAAIACFIALGGEAALVRIERDYLANADANYLDSFAAVGAIRVHGTELDVLPRDRLAAALRQLLARPDLADLVIPDLARWEDWSAVDRVAELFVIAPKGISFVKPAAVLYLKTCPLPSASEALDRLRRIDPEAVQLAEASMMLYPGVASVPVPPPADEATSSEPDERAKPQVAQTPPKPPSASDGKSLD